MLSGWRHLLAALIVCPFIGHLRRVLVHPSGAFIVVCERCHARNLTDYDCARWEVRDR